MASRNPHQRSAKKQGKSGVVKARNHHHPSSPTQSKKSPRKPEPKTRVYEEKTDNCVLMGRGGESNAHPGNQHYLNKAVELAPEYANAKKQEKTNISQRLVDLVATRGGNFLEKERETGRWYVAHPKAARDKAAQALREAVQRNRNANSTSHNNQDDGGGGDDEDPSESLASEADLGGMLDAQGNLFPDMEMDVTSEGTDSYQALGSSMSEDLEDERYRERVATFALNPYCNMGSRRPEDKADKEDNGKPHAV